MAHEHHGAEKPELVTDAPALGNLVRRLRQTGQVAFDTESASFHRYVDRVYLIQISTARETTLIDPLAVPQIDPLGALLADPAIEVVFHDADYDLRVLDRDFGIRARRIFDTRVAAQLAGEEAVGLGSLLTKYFGVVLDKRFQRADWSLRPLPDDMIAYAADDTRHLLDLRQLLADSLASMSRLHWAEEEFRRLEEVRWTGARDGDDDGFLRIKGAKSLPPRQLAILQRLHAWRDGTARALDRAPFRILANPTMLALARRAPQDESGLRSVKGISSGVFARYGSAILEAIVTGLATPQQDLPRIKRGRRPELDPGYEARLERLKQIRGERATHCGLEPGLLCPNGTLQAIARVAPGAAGELEKIPELRAWQREVLGDSEILRAARSP